MEPVLSDVIVNGETIPSAQIAAEVQNHTAPPGNPALAWQAAARALVVRTLLLQAAKRLGLQSASRNVDRSREETRDDALIHAYLDTALTPDPVNDEDCTHAYAAHPQQYRAPDLFEASHILLAVNPNDNAARQHARQAGEKLLKTILPNPDSFAHHAKKSSDCPSAAEGGRLGQIGKGDTAEEFEAVLATLAAGEIHPALVETRYGVHIIRLDKKAEGRVLPFEAVHKQIQQALEKTAWAKAARDLVAGLIRTAEIAGIDMPSDASLSQ